MSEINKDLEVIKQNEPYQRIDFEGYKEGFDLNKWSAVIWAAEHMAKEIVRLKELGLLLCRELNLSADLRIKAERRAIKTEKRIVELQEELTRESYSAMGDADQIEAAEAEANDLRARIKELEADQFRLNGLVKSLDEEKARLSERADKFENSRNEIIHERDNLQARINDLADEIGRVMVERDKFRSDLKQTATARILNSSAAGELAKQLNQEKENYQDLRDVVEARVDATTFKNIIRKAEYNL